MGLGGALDKFNCMWLLLGKPSAWWLCCFCWRLAKGIHTLWRNNSSQVAAIPLRQVLTSCVRAHNDQKSHNFDSIALEVNCALLLQGFLAKTGFSLAAFLPLQASSWLPLQASLGLALPAHAK